MNKSLVFLAASLFSSHELLAQSHHLTVTENPYRYSTYFEIAGDQGFEGRVVKSKFRIRTCYDLFSPTGEYEAEGICQVLSLGSFYVWGKDIDVYDASGVRIGYIDGVLGTTAKARYNIYDAAKEYIATAYLNDDSSGFVVVNSKGRTLAYLKRNFLRDVLDSWDISLFEGSNQLDMRVLKVFAAFAIDYQEYFKQDN